MAQLESQESRRRSLVNKSREWKVVGHQFRKVVKMIVRAERYGRYEKAGTRRRKADHADNFKHYSSTL